MGSKGKEIHNRTTFVPGAGTMSRKGKVIMGWIVGIVLCTVFVVAEAIIVRQAPIAPASVSVVKDSDTVKDTIPLVYWHPTEEGGKVVRVD
jgi:hypothetical protein